MPAHRKPTTLLEASGALAHDPKRHAHRVTEPKPTEALGPAPKHFTPAQKKIWKELVSIAPKGVLFHCDRWVVETACLLMERLRSSSFNTSDIAQLRSCLATLGMTPADRSRVSAANDDKQAQDDPVSLFTVN